MNCACPKNHHGTGHDLVLGHGNQVVEPLDHGQLHLSVAGVCLNCGQVWRSVAPVLLVPTGETLSELAGRPGGLREV